MPGDYKPPFVFRNPHLQTIFPTLFRRVPLVTDQRERIDTPDGDFLDLDWHLAGSEQRFAVITHGLEGSSTGSYCQGMARALSESGWNILAWNFRGCSGEPNLKLKSYHSGATEELEFVLSHLWRRYPNAKVALIGFSLGGNLTLKYVGEKSSSIDSRVLAAVGLSVPCHLKSSAHKLESWENRIYMSRFMRMLTAKVREKMERFPDQIHDHGLSTMKTFAQFDDAYTAPIHGFTNADEYWEQSSSLHLLSGIRLPTLIINAADDPFLTPNCFPENAARTNPHLDLEVPQNGGHLGFVEFNRDQHYWSERRTISFLEQQI